MTKSSPAYICRSYTPRYEPAREKRSREQAFASFPTLETASVVGFEAHRPCRLKAKLRLRL